PCLCPCFREQGGQVPVFKIVRLGQSSAAFHLCCNPGLLDQVVILLSERVPFAKVVEGFFFGLSPPQHGNRCASDRACCQRRIIAGIWLPPLSQARRRRTVDRYETRRKYATASVLIPRSNSRWQISIPRGVNVPFS